MFWRLLYCAPAYLATFVYFALLAASKCWNCVLNRPPLLQFCNSFVLISFLICFVQPEQPTECRYINRPQNCIFSENLCLLDYDTVLCYIQKKRLASVISIHGLIEEFGLRGS
jgi:hypothetical protein